MVFISTASVLVLVTACKMPTAQQEGDERPNVSPSVLFEDDACLGGESRGAGTEMSHCSFDLLQKSGLYSSSQSRPLKELTGRVPSEISTTGDKSGSQELSRSAKHFLVGGRLADSRVGLQAAPSALLTGMSSLAAEVISLGQATPEIKRLAQMYREVLDKGPAKELIEAHKRLKSMFLAQHNALARCAVELDARLESSRQLERFTRTGRGCSKSATVKRLTFRMMLQPAHSSWKTLPARRCRLVVILPDHHLQTQTLMPFPNCATASHRTMKSSQ